VKIEVYLVENLEPNNGIIRNACILFLSFCG